MLDVDRLLSTNDINARDEVPGLLGGSYLGMGPRPRRATRAAQARLLILALLLSDALMLVLAFAVAFWVRFNVPLPVFETEIAGEPVFYSQVVFLLIPVWLALFAVLGLYREQNLLGGTREYSLVFNGATVGTVLVVFVTFLARPLVVARAWLLMSWLISFVLVAGGRFWVRRVVYHLRGRGWFLSRALLVGTNDEALSLAEQLGQWKSSGLEVLGLVATDGADVGGRAGGIEPVGRLDELPELVSRFQVEEVIVATSAVNRQQLVEVFRQLNPRPDVRLRLSGGLFEVLTTGLSVKELAFVPLINVNPARLAGMDRVMKAVLDYGLATGALLLLAPVFALVALAVRWDSPGPVLFRRRVLGMGGREFDAFKFRTMAADGDAILAARPRLAAALARDQKLRDDPRVTRLGRWLRRTSLDELPQLVNVLRGEMSIVGPRMISPAEHTRYGRWDMNLLTVKPGITGLWQVSGRSDITYEERVRLDMSYIRNWTIWSDVQILIQTLPAVLRGRGAY